MMTPREQAIVRMHNAGLSDAEIVAVLAMRGDEAAIECRSAYYVIPQYGAQPLPRAEPWPFKCEGIALPTRKGLRCNFDN